MKTEQINVRIRAEEMRTLGQQATRFQMSKNAVARLYLEASIRAVTAAGSKLVIPLSFALTEEKQAE